MRHSEKRITLLEELCAGWRADRWGWVLDDGLSDGVWNAVKAAIQEGIVEQADRQALTDLAALVGHSVPRALRVTDFGRDVLVYAHNRTVVQPVPREPAPGEQLVKLLPAQMDTLRVFVGVGHRLTRPPVEGLAERVAAAGFSATEKRWHLCLTPEQMESAAYAMSLRTTVFSCAEENRFRREYGVWVRRGQV
ncbi:DUF6417 family protein [Streptomyces niveiscabiei]|uniref:DUF6417 family protein n=1 Tax=Streptomyces niveiscabiei TaxID=164115 RepID=A0ABW9HMQ7_9ACTN|nr:DUF6417 family protein [Streptomyces niveiscabiei]